MSKNEIKINKESLYDNSEENDIINDILKQKFFMWLNYNGFNENKLKYIFYEKRINSTEQNRFNVILRKAKKELDISIIEMILYFEYSFSKIKKILSILDEETKYILKNELLKKYKVKFDKNILYKIL